MRNLKRFLAMTLTMLMVVSCFSFASFAQSFDDVYDYAKAIDTLTNLGVIWGYEDGTFGPDNTVERWHMSLWIAKMETGKVSTDDYLTTWKEEGNYTSFTDVTVDQAIGAINYASEEGIILGTTPTTFAPTAGITYQDALTMVVRALGYGSKAMDAGYPWKYINKAAELGLEDGITGIAYKDVLTRAETAQILYNALYTVDADGESYIADVFGLTNVVITGTPAYRIIETESVIKTGYVSFNVLNADGTINDDVTYHAPATAFGIDAAKADTYVGASFQVTTDDNFKTLGTVIANPSETFDASKIVGQGTPAAPAGTLVTLGANSYEAVKKYSSLYNAQGIKGNTAEILVYTTNLTQNTVNGYFKVDSYYNVLDKDGKIVAYYNPIMTGSYATPYAKRLGNDAYTTYLSNADIIAAGGVWYAITSNEYAQTTNTYDLVKNNKYATATAYDDNSDGVYDRLFYTYEEFGKIYINNDTPAVPNDYYIEDGITRISPVVAKFIDGKTGEALATAPTGYIRYSYNPLSKYLTVYENYTYGTGLVTTVDTANAKIVIGGTQYSVGISTYPGAAYANTGVNIGLVGKQVNFILADGIVVRVFDAAIAATAVVFDNFTGLTSTGYATALVYAQSNQASVITIATIDGLSYQNYMLFKHAGASEHSLESIYDDLETGMLFNGTKDALGFWHLTTANYTYNTEKGTVDFENAIASASGIANFSQFKTNADTLYIVYNEGKDRFFTAKGIPTNDSEIININGGMFVSYTADAVKTASFVYVNSGLFSDDFATLNNTPVSQYDTVIYVDNLSAATCVTNDLGNTTLLGYTYKYGRVLDMVNGKFITVYTTFNFQLQAGKFYTVSNGYVEKETVADIKQGLLFKNDVFSSSIVTPSGVINTETSAYTCLFALDVNKNVAVDAAGNIINYVNNASYNNVFVNYYNGALLHNRVMLITNATAATITIDTKPQTAYDIGETFNPAGLVLKITNGSNTILVNYNNDTAAGFTFDPSTSTALTAANTNIAITFAGKTLNLPITVAATPITGTVVIVPSGDLHEGCTLTANIIGIGPEAVQAPNLSFQWYKTSAIIPGTYTAIDNAAAQTYTLQADDTPCYIVVRVTGIGIYGGTIESAPVGPTLPII